jgi:hypothetical protein
MTNCLGWIQAFWAHLHTVHNAVATENTERIIKVSQTLFGGRIAAIRQKAVGLQQAGWANKLIRVPPERWASR